MGLFYVGCRVLNPATSKSTAVRRLMVDTGAESTWINRTTLEEIGIERRKKDLQFQLANGQIVTRSVGYAVLMVDKSETVDEVVFAEAGDLQLARSARSGRSESASGFPPEKAGGCGPDRQCNRRASAIRTIGAGPPRERRSCNWAGFMRRLAALIAACSAAPFQLPSWATHPETRSGADTCSLPAAPGRIRSTPRPIQR